MRIELIEGLFSMTDKRDGSFSANLLSLQLQLKTLLEGAGGDSAVQVLDLLSALNPSEQKIALRIFSRVLESVRAGEQRLVTAEDQVLKDFEEGLYRDILDSMREAANDNEPRKIEVIDGGKTRRAASNGPIDLDEVRKSRRSKLKPLLN
ncbi:MAG: hypothetical protein J0M12_10040 [Deltaproteobacteria bacterium]|nr:hypothetical protein [Deltaproteobacteria bacterium]